MRWLILMLMLELIVFLIVMNWNVLEIGCWCGRCKGVWCMRGRIMDCFVNWIWCFCWFWIRWGWLILKIFCFYIKCGIFFIEGRECRIVGLWWVWMRGCRSGGIDVMYFRVWIMMCGGLNGVLFCWCCCIKIYWGRILFGRWIWNKGVFLNFVISCLMRMVCMLFVRLLFLNLGYVGEF